MMETNRYPSQQPSARHTEEGERFNRTLFAALDAIENDGLPYALIGGVAASGMGRPRSTHDIDIFVRPEDAEAAIESLEKVGFKTERTDSTWLYKGWKENILVDIIFKSSGDIYFDNEMHGRARLIDYHGRKVRVISPEDLIIIKSAVHNEIGPHHWHDALAILSHAQVDWEYLFKRARRAPRRLLALLIYAQSNDILVPNRMIFDLFHSIFEDAKAHAPRTISGTQNPSRGFLHHTEIPPQGRGSDAYLIGKIKEALSNDSRTGDHDFKIVIDRDNILIRGESTNESQKKIVEEVIQKAAPGFKVINQVRVPHLPGPEGSEFIL
jgi:predicted nucleotidyltransferase